jgi:hypothetical protein
MRTKDHMKKLWNALLLAAMAFAAAHTGAAPITNVTVANVTPSSFSLVWSMEGTPSLEVFSDAAGTTNLAGIAAIEFDPIHTGNAGLTDQTERRGHRAALKARARALGLGHVRVSGLKPATTYHYRLTARLANNNTLHYPTSGLANVTTASETTFVPEAQQLVIDVPGFDNDGRIVTLTHSNAAYALASVVGDGAATNQVFFNLADLLALGGQTNFTAEGSQEFVVDLRGANDSHNYQRFTLVFEGAFAIAQAAYNSFGLEFGALSLGSTIARAGSTGAVTLTLNASVPVREITAQLQVPMARLTALALSNFPPAVASVQIVSNSPTTASFQLTAHPGQSLQGALSLGQLWFRAVSNQTSAFIPVAFDNLLLSKLDGNPVSNVLAQSGRVVLIANEPLLEASVVGGSRRMTIYGKPWSAYALEYSTDLSNPNGWRVHSRIPFTNFFVNVAGLPMHGPNTFYRAAEMLGNPPALEALVGTNGTRRLLVFGAPGAEYTLQSTTNLSSTVAWTPVMTYTLTNSFRYLENLGTNTGATFFRLRRN